MDQGFVDLRANGEGTSGNDSFWPSFTDIMTVVVMIFMLASTVLILRNWELVSELRASIMAEQQATELVRSTAAVNETLEEQLAGAQHQLSVMRMRLMREEERGREIARQLSDRERRLVESEARSRAVSDQLEAATRRNESLLSRMDQVTVELGAVKAAYAQQESRLLSTQEQLEAVEAVSGAQAEELARLRQLSTQAQQDLVALESEYADLKVQYDKLVRPARTAQGKYVVEVRYYKEGGRDRISLKRPEDSERQNVGRGELDGRLAALHEAHGDNLYVKIIIPESSGLSYNEAWTFTQDVLTRYDYYYQQPE